MSLADVVILIVVVSIISVIVFHMVKKKDEGICSNCAYAKKCNDDCAPVKKG